MLYTDCSEHHDLTKAFESALSGEENRLLRSILRTDHAGEFARSVAEGLSKSPKQLDCQFLYDAQGSALYEDICRQQEYYPTRTEAFILKRHALDIKTITGPVTLLELGSGSSIKTTHLLEAYQKNNDTTCYVPIDVSESALRQAGQAITNQQPDVQIIGIHGTYHDAFPLFSAASPAMVIFLGSTIGNLDASQTRVFLQWLASHLQKNDYFLLGVDLVKDVSILEAAYNDAAGVTAAFTKNYFARMNRELGCSLNLDAIKHIARYNHALDQIEIYAHFQSQQRIDIKPAEQSFVIHQGEEILVEISRKFRLEKLLPSLASYGFTSEAVFTDPQNWFGLLLLKKTASAC